MSLSDVCCGSPEEREKAVMSLSFKVLLVEDEVHERKALLRTLQKAFEDLKTAEAKDAVEFEEAVGSFQPDLVLLDIRIPGGDGLSSLEKLRKEGFDGEVVILTAFDIFDYARTAMQLGVTAFLVKPVTPQALTEAVVNALGHVKNRRNHERNVEIMRGMVRENRSAIAANLIHFLLSGEDTEGAMMTVAREIGLLRDDGGTVFGVLAFPNHSETPLWEQLLLWHGLEQSLGHETLVVQWKQHACFVFSGGMGAAEEREAMAGRIFGHLSEKEMQGNVVYGGTWGTLAELPDLLRAVDTGLDESVLEGFGKVLDRTRESPSEMAPFPGDELGIDEFRALVLESIRDGRSSLLEVVQGRLSESLNALVRSDVEILKVLFVGLLGGIAQVLLDLSCDLSEVRIWSRRELLSLFAANSVADLKNRLFFSVSGALELRSRLQTPGNLAIQGALAFIHSHFEDVTLEKAAAAVHVTPAHLSRLFQKALRKRFIDVVKEIRINRAAAYLEAGMSVRDAAIAVGMDNLSYFSTFFKQVMGVSPRDYKKRGEV
jgi:two-component system response regulator YesN